MSKQKEINKLGHFVYRWVKVPEHAADHYAHATVYYNAARSRGASADFVASPNQSKKSNSIVVPGKNGEMVDNLKDYMERKQR